MTDETLPISTRLAIDALAQGTAIKALIATHPDRARFAAMLQSMSPQIEDAMTDGGFAQDVAPETMKAMREQLHQQLRRLMGQAPSP